MRPPLLTFAPLLAVTVALLSSTASARPADTANPFTNASRVGSIFFVPLDAHAVELLKATTPTVKKWLRPRSQITAIAANKPVWLNKARNELNVSTVADDLLARFVQAQGRRPVFIVAVSSKALYSPRNPQLLYVFGAAQGKANQWAAVIGTFPMRFGSATPAEEKARLTKMMLRYVGEVVCQMRRNTNPRSVLYSAIAGPADLDRMVASLPGPPCGNPE
jgi:hypothetical protein